MIDAQAGHLAVGDELQRQPVDRVEHHRVLDADGSERVDVEEAPVVDLLRRDAPPGQSVRLRGQQPVEQVEAARHPGLAVEPAHVLLDEAAHQPARIAERGKPPLHHLLLAPPLLLPGRIALVALRQVLQRGEDAAQIVEVAARDILGLARPRAPHPGVQLGQVQREDLRIGAGVHREAVVEVADLEPAALEEQLQLAALEHRAEAIAEQGQQHLVGQLLLDRVELDVEEASSHRRGAIFEQVPPERVEAADAHVVGDDVEHQAERARPQRGGQRVEVGRRPELRVQLRVVDHVVAVHRAGGGAQDRRAVEVGDAEGGEIRRCPGGGAKVAAVVELQAIGRDRQALACRRGRHQVEQAAGRPLELHLRRRVARCGLAVAGLICAARERQRPRRFPCRALHFERPPRRPP